MIFYTDFSFFNKIEVVKSLSSIYNHLVLDKNLIFERGQQLSDEFITRVELKLFSLKKRSKVAIFT